MKKMADNQYSLSIVDVPYGIDATKMSLGEGGGLYRKPKTYKRGEWDIVAPQKEYFNELFRVSKNQIIWGANHFISKIPFDSSCWIIWDKNNGGSDFADCELAWTSFNSPVRKFTYTWSGFIQGDMKYKQKKIHPTQKPYQLYKYLLKNYAKPGDKILDTHFGSLSIGIACWDAGYDLDAYEIDKDYFEAGKKRLEVHKAQLQVWQ